MTPAIFLDRDGTINRDLGYTYRTKDLFFEDRAIEGLKLLSTLPYLLIIVTNQSGIGRGYFTEKEYHRFTNRLLFLLEREKIFISASYFCPHLPDCCSCRKPGVAMVERAMEEFSRKGTELDIERSFVIGDKTADGELARRIGSSSILVDTGKKGEDGEYPCIWSYSAKNLKEAAEWIQASHTGNL